MRFTEIECSAAVAEMIQSKHGVELAEVEETLANDPYIRRGCGGAYYLSGQTDGGRYLFVVMHDLGDGIGRLATARDMDAAERRAYHRR